jgi:hypothetical protein
MYFTLPSFVYPKNVYDVVYYSRHVCPKEMYNEAYSFSKKRTIKYLKIELIPRDKYLVITRLMRGFN